MSRGLTLRSYQQEAVDILRADDAHILGDDVGLGKTFPALEAAAQNGGHTLIVSPAYLIPQMADAVTQYLPDSNVTPVTRKTELARKLDPGFYICSYHSLMTAGRNALPELWATKWDTVIWDEAHRLRGRRNEWTKNSYALRRANSYMLTGSALVNNPGDMFPLLRLCSPKEFRSYWTFVKTFCEISETPWSTEIGKLRSEMKDEWKRILNLVMLARKKEDYLHELPPAIEHDVWVDLPPTVLKSCRNARESWRIEHASLDEPIIAQSAVALVTRLRQFIANPPTKDNPKLDAVLNIAEDIGERPLVVFTWFRESARIVATALQRKYPGRWVKVLSGDMSALERGNQVKAWSATPNGIVVATMASLQEGANMQHADTLVFFEESYLPSERKQAIGRLHRQGQTNTVNVFTVRAKSSVDQTIHRVNRARATINDEAMDLTQGQAEQAIVTEMWADV